MRRSAEERNLKIKRIQAKNFRNISLADCRLSKVNFIVGDNNAGKSSLLGAAEYALTGGCRFGSDLTQLKTKDADGDAVAVQADTAELGTVTRYIRTGSQINRLGGAAVPDRDIKRALADRTGLTYKTLSLMFGASEFFLMPEKDQKAFVLALTGVSLSPEAAAAYSSSGDAAADAEILRLLKAQAGDGNVTVDMFADIYKKAFAERAARNRTAERLKADAAAAAKAVPEKKTEKDPEYAAKLAELKKKEAALSEKAGRAAQIAVQRKKLAAAVAKGKENIAAVEARTDRKMPCAPEDIAAVRAEIQKLSTEIAADSREAGVRQGTEKQLTGLLEKLKTSGCPLSERLVCTADKTPLISEFAAKIKECADARAAAEKSAEEKKKKSAALAVRAEAMEKNASYIQWIAQNTELLAAREKELDSLKIPDVSGTDSALAALAAEEKKLTEAGEAAARCAQLVSAASAAAARAAEAEKEAGVYALVVPEFAPGGMRSRILAKLVKPLSDAASASMAALEENGSMEFSVTDSGFSVIIGTASGKVTYKELSASEKLRAEIAFQNTVNGLTGAGILAVDEAGMLDDGNFVKFAELIGREAEKYGTVFVAATLGGGRLKDLMPAMLACAGGDCSVFRAEGGKIVSL